MLKSTDAKKPAKCGFLTGDEVIIVKPWDDQPPQPSMADGAPYISSEMLKAGMMALILAPVSSDDCSNLDGLAEEVYTAMTAARPLALRQAEKACLEAQSGPADASSTL